MVQNLKFSTDFSDFQIFRKSRWQKVGGVAESRGCKMSGWQIVAVANCRGCKLSRLQNVAVAKCRGCRKSGCELSGCRLSGCHLSVNLLNTWKRDHVSQSALWTKTAWLAVWSPTSSYQIDKNRFNWKHGTLQLSFIQPCSCSNTWERRWPKQGITSEHKRRGQLRRNLVNWT